MECLRRLIFFALTSLTWLIWLGGGPQAWAATLKVEGSLPRSLESGVFPLTLTVIGVLPSEITAGRGESAEQRLAIELRDVDQTPIGFNADRARTAVARFFLEQRQPPVEIPTPDQNYSVVYYLQVREALPGELKTRMSGGKANLRINVSIGGRNVVRDFLAELTQDAYVVNEAPAFSQGSAILGSQKSLVINFEARTSVATKGGANAAKEPGNMNVYVVDSTVAPSTVTLPAKKFSGQASTPDTNGSCTFTLPTDDLATCVTDCKDDQGATGDVYLNEAEIAKIPGFTVATVRTSDGQATVTGLENGRRYHVFLQYEPDGTQVSSCLAAVPSPNFSLTELNGEQEARVVDVRCFIATAAYGSPLDQRLGIFRRFRDRVLLQTSIGRSLVSAYYRWSPPLAQWIAEHPRARKVVRLILEVPASVLGLTESLY